LELIFESLPATVELTIPTILLSTIGIYIGAYCATKKDTTIDVINKILTTALYSIPVFWLGIMFQLVFGVSLGWLPTGGRIDPRIPITKVTGFVLLDCLISGNMVGLVSAIEHLILPVLTTTIWISCMLNRMARSEMIVILRKDFIVAAKSRGIPKSIIIYKHALKNVLLPIITVMGFTFAWLLGGYVVIETTFSIYGLGRLLVSAINSRDYPLIEGCVFFYAILIGIVSLVIDIIYAYIDPRVKF
jgi:peptide/nickel transport system permease protein